MVNARTVAEAEAEAEAEAGKETEETEDEDGEGQTETPSESGHPATASAPWHASKGTAWSPKKGCGERAGVP